MTHVNILFLRLLVSETQTDGQTRQIYNKYINIINEQVNWNISNDIDSISDEGVEEDDVEQVCNSHTAGYCATRHHYGHPYR